MRLKQSKFSSNRSCRLESIDLNAFDRLSLVVELDLSWNQLARVPLPQTSHLSLMRRFSMRGNPLRQLDELTLSLEMSKTTNRQANKVRSQDPNATLLSPFVENYPDLARSLVDANSEAKGRNEIPSQPQLANWRLDMQLMENLSRLSRDSFLEPTQEESADETENEIESDSQADNSIEREDPTSIGSHFVQLQELDFGRCQLRYIRWTTLRRLDQLKRLYLDGNQLR